MKIQFKPVCAVPNRVLERRRQWLAGKYPSPPKAVSDKLAVVGGGPSASRHIDEIRSFDAIWAINGTWRWLRDQGIPSTGFTLDSLFDDFAPETIFGDGCDPAKIRRCHKPYVASLVDVVRGTTTATAAPILGIKCGYKQIHFFGCEGSFEGGKTHTFKTIDGNRLWMTCNGGEFVTNPQMFLQCEVLAQFMRLAPDVFIDRSGGLLAAMIVDPEADFTAASPDLHKAVMGAIHDNHDI